MRYVIWAAAMLAFGYVYGALFLRQLILCFSANRPIIARLTAADAIEKPYAVRRNILFIIVWIFLALLIAAAIAFYGTLYCGVWAPILFFVCAAAALFIKRGHYGPDDEANITDFLANFRRCLVDRNLLYYVQADNDRQVLVIYHRLTDEVQ